MKSFLPQAWILVPVLSLFLSVSLDDVPVIGLVTPPSKMNTVTYQGLIRSVNFLIAEKMIIKISKPKGFLILIIRISSSNYCARSLRQLIVQWGALLPSIGCLAKSRARFPSSLLKANVRQTDFTGPNLAVFRQVFMPRSHMACWSRNFHRFYLHPTSQKI